MKPKIAVIYFPGCNCENESKLACEKAGMEADIINWNTTKDLNEYDGFFIVGGWSYEDRVRAGAVSARDPLMLKIKEQAKLGKVVLGVCNGCQVLVESGIIPGLSDKVGMAVAPNINPFVSGYYCTWVKVKNNLNKKNAFNEFFDHNEVIDLPIAHAEGRFVTKDPIEDNQILFKYCDENGNETKEFPVNPNGAMENIAGIINKEGNVLAMMPHPERAFFKKSLKEKEMHNFEDAMTLAAGAKVFESIREYIKSK